MGYDWRERAMGVYPGSAVGRDIPIQVDDLLARWTSAFPGGYAVSVGASPESCRRPVPCPTAGATQDRLKIPPTSSQTNAF